MCYIKHLVRRYPMQSFLILFNAGYLPGCKQREP